MDCFYINLDSQVDRREFIEGMFANYKKSTWNLIRERAIGKSDIEFSGVPGSLSFSEKACYLSHLGILEKKINANSPFMVLEDDVIFGQDTCDVIENSLSQLGNGVDWDLIFTDIGVSHPVSIIELIFTHKGLMKRKMRQLINLEKLDFFGSTSYIVNHKSTNKLLSLLTQSDDLNVPYDLLLRQLIHEGKLKSYVIFPFVTSISIYADKSQIQTDLSSSSDLVWNSFRRLIWGEYDAEKMKAALTYLDEKIADDNSRNFSIILSALISNKFRLE
jgi:GR25 family glycosyltransferase involved in LPS biosynthesis